MNHSNIKSNDEKRIEKIREIAKDLPSSCGDFLRGIATTTSTLTRLVYAYDLRIFFAFLLSERVTFSDVTVSTFTDENVALINQSDLECFVEYLSFYFKTNENNPKEQQIFTNHELGISRKLSTLRSYFEYLFRSKRIPANIGTLVPLPKIHEKPILRMEMDEVAQMLSIVQNGEALTPGQLRFQSNTKIRDYAILSLFLGTGIRVSECVGINIDDIDFKNNAFLVTRKGGNQVTLYFPQIVSVSLKAYMEQRIATEALAGHEDAFFLSLQRRRISQRAVEIMVKKYATIAAPLKKKLSPHKLRSTYATNLYNETGDIYLVADALGHSNVNTTRKHYAAISEERRREAAKHIRLPSEGDNPTKQ